MDSKYKPLEWVGFSIGRGQAWGQILGALKNDRGWLYFINNPAGDGNTAYSVTEANIIAILMNGEWEDASIR